MRSIFLAESENHVRAALHLMIEYQPGMVIAGEADHCESLLVQVCKTPPDVIILDWNLSGFHPHRLIRTLREHCPKTILVATSVKPEQEKVARRWGVDGFLLKQLPPELFMTTLETIVSKQFTGQIQS